MADRHLAEDAGRTTAGDGARALDDVAADPALALRPDEDRVRAAVELRREARPLDVQPRAILRGEQGGACPGGTPSEIGRGSIRRIRRFRTPGQRRPSAYLSISL